MEIKIYCNYGVLGAEKRNTLSARHMLWLTVGMK